MNQLPFKNKEDYQAYLLKLKEQIDQSNEALLKSKKILVVWSDDMQKRHPNRLYTILTFFISLFLIICLSALILLPLILTFYYREPLIIAIFALLIAVMNFLKE